MKKPTRVDLLIEGLTEAVAIARGRRHPARTRRVAITARDVTVSPPPPRGAGRIRAIRQRLRVSQSVFAAALNVSAATVRSWEQGARVPDGPSLRLLEIAERHPEVMLDGLTP